MGADGGLQSKVVEEISMKYSVSARLRPFSYVQFPARP